MALTDTQSRRDAVTAARTFATSLLGGEASAFYRIDHRHDLHDFRMDEALAAFHRAYMADLHAIDPFHARRLKGSAATVCCLSRDLADRPSPQAERYASACAAHGIGDMVELMFRREGHLSAGLCITWPAGQRADGEPLVRARAAHAYLEFTLQALDEPASPSPLERAGLTNREREVVALICAGRANRDIALSLGITLATVKTHVIRIFEKLGVENRASVVALAARR